MAFIDILALEEVLILMAAVLVGYVGALGAYAMYRNDAAGLQGALKGAAAPLFGIGSIATVFGVWGEMVWPYPAPYLTSYNILFNDIFLLFGLTMLALAASLALSLKLQYAGLFALVAGGVTIAYGWSGYQLGMTKDPFETFLLYGAFGLAGLLAFPATLGVDHYLAHPESATFHSSSVAVARRRPSFAGATRAVQPVPGASSPDEGTVAKVPLSFRVPVYINATLIVFLVAVALAGIAALFYLDSTVPAHLAKAP
jgi:putative membrane protein